MRGGHHSAGGPVNEAADSGRTRIAGVPSETIAEAVFLVLIGVAFVYLLIVSRGWPMAAALLPTIASGVGLPLLIVHVYRRFRQVSGQRRRILDIGFTDEGLERRVVHLRTVQMLGTMVAMFVGIWLVGFHIALPLYVFLYLVT